MAKIDELTVNLVVNPCEKVSISSEKVGMIKALGKENVAKCIKNVGQYIIDNAERFVENVDKTVSIDINSRFSVNDFPEVEVIYTNQITDTSMFDNATTEQ